MQFFFKALLALKLEYKWCRKFCRLLQPWLVDPGLSVNAVLLQIPANTYRIAWGEQEQIGSILSDITPTYDLFYYPLSLYQHQQKLGL